MIQQNGLSKTKIMSVSSDSAANIKLAIQLTVRAAKWVPCVAHLLSHLVPDTLSEVSSTIGNTAIEKVKSIVRVIRSSTLGTDELIKLQRDDGKTDSEVLLLKQANKIRWNSTLYMLQRCLEIEDYVFLVIKYMKEQSEKNKKANVHKIELLNDQGLAVLRDLVPMIEFVEFFIREVSGEKDATASLAIPTAHCLELNVNSFPPETTYGIEFKRQLLIQVTALRVKVEENIVLSMSTILDPRFKKIHFANRIRASNAVQRIDSVLKQLGKTLEKKNPPEESPKVKTSHNFWSAHDQWVEKSSFPVDSDECESNLSQYSRQPLQGRPEEALELWRTLKISFPLMYDVAIRYLGLLCSSVPSERLFSDACNRKNKKTNRLTGDHLGQLVCLGSCPPEDWHLS